MEVIKDAPIARRRRSRPDKNWTPAFSAGPVIKRQSMTRAQAAPNEPAPAPVEEPSLAETESSLDWLDELPTKPIKKVYQVQGDKAGTSVSRASKVGAAANFRVLKPAKGRWRVCGEQRDFRLPPNVYAPKYPLCSVNGWKTLPRNSWTRDALALFEKPVERVPSCICRGKCDEDCLNRITKIECDVSCCPWQKEDCGNRAIQAQSKLPQWVPETEEPYPGNRLLYARGYEVFATGPKGFGLRAVRDYEPHELILEYTGEVITNDEMYTRMESIYSSTKRYYCLTFVNGLVIDSGRRGSEARFVNHSCNPNCEMQKWYVKGTPRVALYAGDEMIPAGTEFTYDYNFDIFKGATGQKCYCNEYNCRGIIGKRFPKEKERLDEEPLKFKISFKKAVAEAVEEKAQEAEEAPNGTPRRRSRRAQLQAEEKQRLAEEVQLMEEYEIETPNFEQRAAARAERAAQRASLTPITWKTQLPRMRRKSARRSRKSGEFDASLEGPSEHSEPLVASERESPEAPVEEEAPVKRRRGRPRLSEVRKRGRPRTDQQDSSLVQLEDEQELEPEGDDTPSKRRRARTDREYKDPNYKRVSSSESQGFISNPTTPGKRRSARISYLESIRADESDFEGEYEYEVRVPEQSAPAPPSASASASTSARSASAPTEANPLLFQRIQQQISAQQLALAQAQAQQVQLNPTETDHEARVRQQQLTLQQMVLNQAQMLLQAGQPGQSQPPLYIQMNPLQLQQYAQMQSQMMQFMQQQGVLMMPNAMYPFGMMTGMQGMPGMPGMPNGVPGTPNGVPNGVPHTPTGMPMGMQTPQPQTQPQTPQPQTPIGGAHMMMPGMMGMPNSAGPKVPSPYAMYPMQGAPGQGMGQVVQPVQSAPQTPGQPMGKHVPGPGTPQPVQPPHLQAQAQAQQAQQQAQQPSQPSPVQAQAQQHSQPSPVQAQAQQHSQPSPVQAQAQQQHSPAQSPLQPPVQSLQQPLQPQQPSQSPVHIPAQPQRLASPAQAQAQPQASSVQAQHSPHLDHPQVEASSHSDQPHSPTAPAGVPLSQLLNE